MFKKNVHPLSTTDLFVTGRERMKKSLAKTRQNALRKQERYILVNKIFYQTDGGSSEDFGIFTFEVF